MEKKEWKNLTLEKEEDLKDGREEIEEIKREPKEKLDYSRQIESI